ncbi:polycystin-1-like protein 2 [Menidia menidia]
MCWTVLQVLALLKLTAQSAAKTGCAGDQRCFRGSCYEFVGRELSFHDAQHWCEDRGGHLAVIPDKGTQHFLERHLNFKNDTWIGRPWSSSSKQQYSFNDGGPLSWWNGSHVLYSKRARAVCGHLSRNLSFLWETTGNCTKKKTFICQYKSRRSVVFPGDSRTLLCSSGQTLIIDGGFYGHKNCPSRLSSPTASQDECGWVDVLDSIKDICQGRRLCRLAKVVNSVRKLCPEPSRYLTVHYRCVEGLALTMKTTAAVSDDVPIRVKWLQQFRHLPFTCELHTGDGHIFYLQSPEGPESTVVHRYTHHGAFMVSAHCSSSDTHVQAQKRISIQEPVTEIGVIKCYSRNTSFSEANCKALYGGAFQIQTEVKAGSNVVYRIQRGEELLAGMSVVRGSISQNITVTPKMVQKLGPGCHKLTLHASNMVTFPEVSRDLQVCIVEEISGLRAAVVRESCVRPHGALGVSLTRGAPVQLFFSLTGDHGSFSETKRMNSKRRVFHIRHPIRGSKQVKVRAWNEFSSMEVVVDVLSLCGKDLGKKVKEVSEHLLSLPRNEKSREQHARVARSLWEINADPSNSVSKKDEKITLSIIESSITADMKKFKWESTKGGGCKPKSSTSTLIIEAKCLPDPFHFEEYSLKLNNDDSELKSICITLTPKLSTSSMSLKCSEACEPVEDKKHAEIVLDCESGSCEEVVWYIRDPNGEDEWETQAKDCYKKAGETPLIKKQDGKTEYQVKHQIISEAKSKGQDITVVAITDSDEPQYLEYVLKTSSSSKDGEASTTSSSQTTNMVTKEKPTTSANPAKATTGTGSTTATGTAGTAGTAGTTGTASVPAGTTGTKATEATTRSFESLSCVISPSTGTVLDAFSVTCTAEVPCGNCQYCFRTEDQHLLCSDTGEVKAVYLPLGDLFITATAKNSSFAINTTLTAQVRDSSAGSETIQSLNAAVQNASALLKKNGQLSGQRMGQLITSVANKLNDQSVESTEQERLKLRELILQTMIDAIQEAPVSTTVDVQVVARGLEALVQKGSELTLPAQVEASTLLNNLSLSLLHMNLTKSDDNKKEILSSVSVILAGVGSILSYSSNKNISDVLLGTLSNTQSALLTQKEINEGPTIVNQSQISMLVSRVTPENLHRESLSVANSSRPAFSLPELPPNMFSTEKSVDIRMLSLDKNPFSWNERSNISGQIGALSLTTKNGSGIPVENLSEDIEILLPRDPGEPESSSVLDLGNYSTTVIDVPSADTTLVLKLLPSVDPLPFKVFLGHMDYPTQSNFVAMTQMPQQGLTQEERYTWLLDPKLLKGNTGLHYLVVRPIVGPGVKSINASLSISSITSSCKFWNESQLDWSDSGCRVGVKSTHLVTQCLCNHLTFFGSSFFVTPNLVDPSRTAELFANFAENPVVVCFVGALFVAFLLVVVWARRKDLQDKTKVKVTVLEDNDPMERYCYLLSVSTGHRIGASTSAKVVVTLLGSRQNSEPHHLTDQKKHLFERGAVDLFLLTTPFSLGELRGIRLWHDNSGSHPAWYVGNIMVKDLQTEEKWHFLCNSWLAIDLGDCCLDKVFPASTETDLKSFSNLFSMKTTKDFSDGHLWYSVIGRPANSSFTCVQRVSCCFSLLLCTMLTSIMFYGIPEDPSDQVMDLGHFEFTWQQFMIGVQSSLIMFPVNILIVAVFRNTRPRETPCCQRQTEKTNQEKQIALQEENTLQIVPPKTEKNNLPCAGFEVADINALLSKVEAFLKEKDETSNETKSPLPASTPEGIPADSYEVQYLYRQLCHTEKELASSSADHHSPSQALQKVRHMKSSLQARLIPSGSTHLHEPLYDNYRSVPADGAATVGGQKRKVCCSGMLPWWFIFVGWLLVIGTSCVSGYFIMLYGLKFGKERSISWLVSTIVSFFQSILLIQPLKVVGLAVFFALVIKKVDDEDLQNVTFESMNENQGHFGNVQMSRRDVGLYEPPPSADVQIMKRNRVLEQRAFALLREILAYVGFMWMLLLVAYGQRDPNAFFLNQHIRKSFTDSVPESMSLQDVFTWANTSLLTNLFGNYPGFITDGNSKLVGNARLRQLRVQKNQCQVGDPVLALVAECHAPYVGGVEDMGSYEPGWNRTVNDNSSENASGPWRYRTQAQLRAQPFWGRMGLYRGGGFVVELGPDLSNASSTLEYLFRNKWLDVYTRAIFVEFTVYNANVNLFCIVTLLMETSAVGAFQFSSDLQSVRLYQSTGGLYFFVMAAEIVYMLFILYYMVLQGKLLKQQGWVYFKNKWNLLDLSIILLSWSALAFFIMRTLLGNRDMSFYQKNKDQFASFYETASADLMFQYLIAFIVLLATVKLWHLLRLNPKMNLITAALQRAWSDISGFLVVIIVVFVAYSMTSNVIYGWKISSYKTFSDSLLTIISLQIGIFNYDEVLDSNPVLGGLLFGSCAVLVTFVLLNLFISVILVALQTEQLHHKPSEEEETVDIMLKIICNLFGIRHKTENVAPGPDMNGSSDVALNNAQICP